MGSPDSVAIKEGNFHGNGIPFDSFDTNAVGMLNLLEATRQARPGAHSFTQALTRCAAMLLTD